VGELLPLSLGHGKRVWTVAFSPDGKWLASGSHDGKIRLWDLEAQPLRSTILSDGPQVWAVAFAPDGRQERLTPIFFDTPILTD